MTAWQWLPDEPEAEEPRRKRLNERTWSLAYREARARGVAAIVAKDTAAWRRAQRECSQLRRYGTRAGWLTIESMLGEGWSP